MIRPSRSRVTEGLRRWRAAALLVGALCLVLLGAGAGWPWVQALGWMVLGGCLVVTGVDALRSRRFAMPVSDFDLESHSRYRFSGCAAMSFGLWFVVAGGLTILLSSAWLVGADGFAEQLVRARPGLVLAPLGFLFSCTSFSWLYGEEEMNRSQMHFWTSLPQRLGGLVALIFSLTLLAVGVFELVAPATFDALWRSLQPPELPVLPSDQRVPSSVPRVPRLPEMLIHLSEIR